MVPGYLWHHRLYLLYLRNKLRLQHHIVLLLDGPDDLRQSQLRWIELFQLSCGFIHVLGVLVLPVGSVQLGSHPLLVLFTKLEDLLLDAVVCVLVIVNTGQVAAHGFIQLQQDILLDIIWLVQIFLARIVAFFQLARGEGNP